MRMVTACLEVKIMRWHLVDRILRITDSERTRRHLCQGPDGKWECRFCSSRVSTKHYLVAHTCRDHEGFSGCEGPQMVQYLADMDRWLSMKDVFESQGASVLEHMPATCRTLRALLLPGELEKAKSQNYIVAWTHLSMLPKCALWVPAKSRGGRKCLGNDSLPVKE